MKPLKNRLQQVAHETGSQLGIVEKDYVLSYILAGIASEDSLREALVFKGGTALKKCYFGDYRFSEDLDFSTVQAPQGDDLEQCLVGASEWAKGALSQHGPFSVILKRYQEKEPHPGGQEAFDIRVQFPWHPSPLCRVKVEVTHDEPVLIAPVEKSVLHGYEETLSSTVRCYSLEEIVAEKMRSLLQTHQKLVARGWNRPRSRDYYDLWKILTTYSKTLNHLEIKVVLAQKCELRSVSYRTVEDFFTPELLTEIETYWQSNLGAYVKELPESPTLLNELCGLMKRYVE